MMSRWIALLAIGCAAGLSAAVGCGGSDGGADDDDHGHGETLKNAACQTITEACHHVAEESGRPAECHDIAHDDQAAPCQAAVTSCVAACKAAE